MTYYASWTDLPTGKLCSRSFCSEEERRAYRAWWAMYPGRTADWRYWPDYAPTTPTPTIEVGEVRAAEVRTAEVRTAEVLPRPQYGVSPKEIMTPNQILRGHYLGRIRALAPLVDSTCLDASVRHILDNCVDMADTYSAECLREEYASLGHPAVSRFACSVEDQLRWLSFLRPVEAEDESGAMGRYVSEEDAVASGATVVRVVRCGPPEDTLPCLTLVGSEMVTLLTSRSSGT